MLAVLPFQNLNRDPEQEYFSDGLTEEMIAQLGRINPQLSVIDRSSAMHYKNTDRKIEHVRREAGSRLRRRRQRPQRGQPVPAMGRQL